MAKQIDFWTLLTLTQEHISQRYAAALTDKSKLGQLKSYIDKTDIDTTSGTQILLKLLSRIPTTT